MKRLLCSIIFVLLSFFSIFAEDIKLPRLAVVEFSINDYNNAKLKNDAVAVRSQVQSNIVKTGRYDVIARAEIDKLLVQSNIAVSSISDKANLKKLSLLQIAYLVTGDVMAMDNSYLVAISMIDVASGQVIHSDNLLMGNSATEIYQKTSSLVSNFMNALKSNRTEIISEPTRRNTTSMGAIGIHVETGVAGVLYISENNSWKELASLWDGDSYDIPIEKPAIYKVKIRYPDGAELTRTVNINSRGIYNVFFTLPPEECIIESVTGTTIKLSWKYEEEIDSYCIKFYPSGKQNEYKTTYTTSGSKKSSAVITDLDVGTEYTFEIESLEEYSNSRGKVYPSKPTILKTKTSDLKVNEIFVNEIYYCGSKMQYSISDCDLSANRIWYYSESTDFSTAQEASYREMDEMYIDEVLGLKPNSTYYLWLVLSENEGYGKPSACIKIQTPEYKRTSDEVFVEGGTYMMGSPNYYDYESRPIHEVTVSSFFICKHEVTNIEYSVIMNDYNYSSKEYNFAKRNVSWLQAIDFCNKLSDKEGFEKCYVKKGYTYECNFKANGYRLPTEAEWEFAARGGNKSNGFEFSGSNNFHEVCSDGWREDNYMVMTKSSNELGIYDMSGNVAEYCWDIFTSYSSDKQTNPYGGRSGHRRVTRAYGYTGDGGFGSGSSVYLRYWLDEDDKYLNEMGFRVVRSSSK